MIIRVVWLSLCSRDEERLGHGIEVDFTSYEVPKVRRSEGPKAG